MLILSTANSYTGTTLVNAGALSVLDAGALGSGQFEIVAVPEPGTLLAPLGLFGLAGFRERRHLRQILRGHAGWRSIVKRALRLRLS